MVGTAARVYQTARPLITLLPPLFVPGDDRYAGQPEHVTMKVQPEPGMAIIFNHKVMHEGGAVGESEQDRH